MGILTIVNGAVNADGPHARSISVTVTVVFLSTVSGSPHVNVTQSLPTLKKVTEPSEFWDLNPKFKYSR
jgi:hypothetical protein